MTCTQQRSVLLLICHECPGAAPGCDGVGKKCKVRHCTLRGPYDGGRTAGGGEFMPAKFLQEKNMNTCFHVQVATQLEKQWRSRRVALTLPLASACWQPSWAEGLVVQASWCEKNVHWLTAYSAEKTKKILEVRTSGTPWVEDRPHEVQGHQSSQAPPLCSYSIHQGGQNL